MPPKLEARRGYEDWARFLRYVCLAFCFYTGLRASLLGRLKRLWFGLAPGLSDLFEWFGILEPAFAIRRS